MTPKDINRTILTPALKLLPARMDTPEARVMLVAINLQESKGIHRWQVIDLARPQLKGPARSLWQFELGTKASRGGVWGVYLHAASRYWLSVLCEAYDVEFSPRAIWLAMERNDQLAAGVARLLLFTDPKPLPAVSDVEGAWQLYAKRTWRPGALKRQAAELRAKWTSNHALARAAVGV